MSKPTSKADGGRYGTREQCERRVRGATRGMTEPQIQAATERHYAGESVWHAAAQVCGTACHCANCRPDIRRFA
jgi:hypothetical protein